MKPSIPSDEVVYFLNRLDPLIGNILTLASIAPYLDEIPGDIKACLAVRLLSIIGALAGAASALSDCFVEDLHEDQTMN